MLKISCKISVLLYLFLVVVLNKSIMQYITSHHHLVTHHHTYHYNNHQVFNHSANEVLCQYFALLIKKLYLLFLMSTISISSNLDS